MVGRWRAVGSTPRVAPESAAYAPAARFRRDSWRAVWYCAATLSSRARLSPGRVGVPHTPRASALPPGCYHPPAWMGTGRPPGSQEGLGVGRGADALLGSLRAAWSNLPQGPAVRVAHSHWWYDPRVPLHLETFDGFVWKPIGELRQSQPPGSLSNNADGRRELIQFECKGDHSEVKRSIAGADAEVGPMRVMTTVGFETLAVLRDGQEFELDLRTDLMVRPRRVRFRHADLL